MKLYAHWQADQPFTKVIKIQDDSTVANLQEACCAAFQSRFPELATLGPVALRLLGPDDKALPLSSPLSAVLSNGDDVFCSLAPASRPVEPQKADATCVTTLGEASATSLGTWSPLTSTSAPNPTRVGAFAATTVTATAAGSTPIAATQPCNQAGPSPHPAKGSASATAPTSLAPLSGSQVAAAAGDSADSQPAMEHLMPLVHVLWQRAEAAAAQQNYRSAGETLQQVFLLAPQPSQPAHLATLRRLARLWLDAGNPAAAVRWALQAAEARPEDPDVLELAGDCLREGGRPREAALHYQSALELLEESQEAADESDTSSGSPTGNSSSGGPAGPSADPASSHHHHQQQFRLRLSLADCLYDLPGGGGSGMAASPYDNQELAASLVMAVLERDPSQWDALRLYCRIALDRGIRDDALRVALRLVVARPQHGRAKGLLAECLKDEEGCRMLLEELAVPVPSGLPASGGGGGGSGTGGGGGGGKEGGAAAESAAGHSAAAALGFVATAIKDHGKVDSCIALLQHAVRLHPGSASYCLNLVHALELRQDLQGALEAGRAYCRSSGTQLAGVPLRELDSLLADVPQLRRATDLTWYLAKPRWGAAGAGAEAEAVEGAGQRRGADTYTAADGAGVAGGGAAEGEAKNAQGSGGSSGSKASKSKPAGKVQVSYSPDQLDELALLFTLSKVLFVGGALAAAARLCEAVEPLRSASAVELHTTIIRNEAAYFGCVRQLLSDHPPPPAPSAAPRPVPACAAGAGAVDGGDSAAGPAPLYLCGDSHCLSAAWRVVTLRGEERLLRPLLVTGCKVWHLRPSSMFYPKKQFEAAMRLVPDGSQVVLVLGEIDCREGLLLAVQKGKYDSVAEGIDATVAIYLDVLRRLVSERSLELFVHPVPPVLNETRHIVAPFAAALRRGVAAARKADPALRARLHYLDFFQELLAPLAAGTGATAAEGRPGAATGAGAGASPAGASGDGPDKERAGASSTGGIAEEAGVAVATGEVGPRELAGASAGGGADSAASKSPDPAMGQSGSTSEGQVDGATWRAEAAESVSGWVLREELAFDGTHLSPVYVPLLNSALQALQ